jgi:hypothetical protein
VAHVARGIDDTGINTAAILDDLKEIAEADGKFDDNEKAMIAGLEAFWA